MEPPKPNALAAMEAMSDREWSIWAANKAIEANAVTGSFADSLREIKMFYKMSEGDMKSFEKRLAKLEEDVQLILTFLAESGSAAGA